MDRRLGHGIAALGLALTMALAGAVPAAAEEIGFFERGLGWWTALWGGEAPESSEGGLLSVFREALETDKGLGVDPNGGLVVSQEPPPDETSEL